MIRQDELKVKVGETKSAVTGFGGVSALVGVAYQTGMADALDSRLQQVKRRCRGYAPSASVVDLMLLLCAGGECIDDLAVLREDRGLRRLLRIPALVVRHARTLWLRAPRGHPYLATLRASLA